jgi:hypothetical protein
MVQILDKVVLEGTYIQMIKAMCEKPIANVTFKNRKKMENFITSIQ